jgi:ferritin
MAEAQMLPWDGQLPLAHLLHLQLHRSMNAKLLQSELYVNVSMYVEGECFLGYICIFMSHVQ